jgi:hypothetical protein
MVIPQVSQFLSGTNLEAEKFMFRDKLNHVLISKSQTSLNEGLYRSERWIGLGYKYNNPQMFCITEQEPNAISLLGQNKFKPG